MARSSTGALLPLPSTATAASSGIRVALVASVFALCACQSRLSDGAAREPVRGGLRFALTLADGVDIDEVTYMITRAGGFEQIGTIPLLADKSTFKALVMLPSASAYSLELSAVTAQGATCSGHARFDIWPDRKTAVNVLMRCAGTPQLGAADLNGIFNVCPAIDSVVAVPDHAVVGDAVGLYGSAHDPDNPGVALSYLWTTTSGMLVDDTAATTSLRCTQPGVAAVRLTVSDGDNGCDVSSAVFDVTCDPASTGGSAGSGTGGVSAPTGGSGGAAVMPAADADAGI